MELLVGLEVDELLRLPAGKAKRLAHKGQLPHLLLPSGKVRFLRSEIEDLITRKHRAVFSPAKLASKMVDGVLSRRKDGSKATTK